jgi:hypothetical protein
MKTDRPIIVNQGDPAFEKWLAGCIAMVQLYQQQNYPSLPAKNLETEWGTRYIRICDVERNTGADAATRPSNRRGAWAFIDRTTGDVLKPASFKTPAKHARGNIFDPQNGMGSMGAYGPAYLR